MERFWVCLNFVEFRVQIRNYFLFWELRDNCVDGLDFVFRCPGIIVMLVN